MPEYIKDTECSRDTPVIWGKLSDRSYGTMTLTERTKSAAWTGLVLRNM